MAQFATHVLHFPQQRAGVVVLANTSINATSAAFQVADAFLGNALGARADAANPLATAPTVNVTPATLDRYVGLYRLGPGWYVRIRLWLDDFGGSMWFTRSVEFERDASGRVTAFAVFVDERRRHIRFTRRATAGGAGYGG